MNLPEHSFCLPQFVRHDLHELAPNEHIENHDVQDVYYE